MGVDTSLHQSCGITVKQPTQTRFIVWAERLFVSFDFCPMEHEHMHVCSLASMGDRLQNFCAVNVRWTGRADVLSGAADELVTVKLFKHILCTGWTENNRHPVVQIGRSLAVATLWLRRQKSSVGASKWSPFSHHPTLCIFLCTFFY